MYLNAEMFSENIGTLSCVSVTVEMERLRTGLRDSNQRIVLEGMGSGWDCNHVVQSSV
jgi:3-oxoacyl-[acyl-carrier-protein] synthase III